LVWLVAVTSTASVQKIFAGDPKLGLLAHAKTVTGSLAFADYLDAVVAGFFLVSVLVVVIDAVRVWLRVISPAANLVPQP
jgi:carbon starvation protein